MIFYSKNEQYVKFEKITKMMFNDEKSEQKMKNCI